MANCRYDSPTDKRGRTACHHEGIPISTTTRLTRLTGLGSERSGLGLFVRRWIADPIGIGAVLPSAPGLAYAMAREARVMPGEVVVELGPGTGAVTHALIAMGVPENRLVLIERDPEMYDFLCERFPGAEVIQGDAADLDRLLPAEQRGRVSSVVSSLPLVSFPPEGRKAILNAALRVLSPEGRFVQYTYGPFSPIDRDALGLDGRRVEQIWINVPPASVWSYTRAVEAVES